jgi:hypothetical protein
MPKLIAYPSLRSLFPCLLFGWAVAACGGSHSSSPSNGSEATGGSPSAQDEAGSSSVTPDTKGTGGRSQGSGGAAEEPADAGSSSEAGATGAGGAEVVPIDDVTPGDLVYQSLDAERVPLVEFKTTQVDVTPAVEQYELPVAALDVLNIERDIASNGLFTWSSEQQSKLLQNGLVVVNGRQDLRHFEDAYAKLKSSEIPILVTSDSTLHLYHLFFDQLLKNIELTSIIPMHRAMLPRLADTLASMVVALDGDTREAARRTLAYVSVAGALLDPDNFQVYDDVSDEVAKDLELIEAAADLDIEPILDRGCTRDLACSGADLSDEDYAQGNACLCEDFTQYKPRGHYTEAPDLERYFKSTMYLGRIGLRIKSPMETRMAALLTAALGQTRVSYGGKDLAAGEIWNRVYSVTSYFAGTSDDLTFVEYDAVLRAVCGDGYSLQDLDSADKLERLRTELEGARKPKILSGFVQAGLDKAAQTMGLRFYGQRFAFDSYVLGQLVFDHVGPNPLDPNYQTVIDHLDPGCRVELDGQPISDSFETCDGQTLSDWNYICCSAAKLAADAPEVASVCRFLPKGLDVAAAFGSERARTHLKPDLDGYCGYSTELDAVTSEASDFTPEDWGKNLYTSWLYGLNPLFAGDFAGSPTWMTGDAYRDKSLNTSLASWAELRHDTILYVKQSYTAMNAGSAAPIPPPEAMYYVEPLPTVYSRLADLARMTETGLKAHGMFPPAVSDPNGQLITLLDKLTSIAKHELEGASLTQDETDTIDSIGATMEYIVASLGSAVTIPAGDPPSDEPYYTLSSSVQGDPYKTAVVADVHTDGNLEQVLEVASGQVDWMVVVNRLADGSLGAAVGPIFSYYEFAWPMRDRLNDTQWGELLSGTDVPARPAFLDGIRAP